MYRRALSISAVNFRPEPPAPRDLEKKATIKEPRIKSKREVFSPEEEAHERALQEYITVDTKVMKIAVSCLK